MHEKSWSGFDKLLQSNARHALTFVHITDSSKCVIKRVFLYSFVVAYCFRNELKMEISFVEMVVWAWNNLYYECIVWVHRTSWCGSVVHACPCTMQYLVLWDMSKVSTRHIQHIFFALNNVAVTWKHLSIHSHMFSKKTISFTSHSQLSVTVREFFPAHHCQTTACHVRI